jgi:hypothetical protein
MKAGRELRTDMEKRISGNYASVAPAAAVAGQTAGALAWFTTNVSRGRWLSGQRRLQFGHGRCGCRH